MDIQKGAPPTVAEARSHAFPCPSCGGELHWDPGATQMKCPFCDSLVDIPKDGAFQAEEHDLMEFLERHPKAEGYGVPMDEFSCKSCGATAKVPGGRRDMNCPFCGTTYIFEAKKAAEEVLQPESVVPFSISKESCLEKFKKWIGTGWFRPNDLKKLGKLDRITGIYMPYFTFDAQADSDWTADAGHYYYVTERVAVTRNGKTEYENRQVQKIRWEPASGRRSDFYDDVTIPAVSQQRLDLMTHVLPFDMKGLKPYDTRFLSGFSVLNAEVPLKQVYGVAKANVESDQRSRCSGDVPGDTQRNLSVRTLLSRQTFKHLMCPLWVGSFKYKAKVFAFLINGQTGALYGEKPWSWVKIVLFILSLIAAGFVVYLILNK